MQQHKRRTSAGDLAHLRELFRHHIDSFDYLITAGLGVMLRDIKPVQVDNSLTGETLRIWFADDPILGRPLKDRSSEPLYPFECRQTRISYTGKLLADIYFQRGDKAPVREQFNFGQFPIMLMSKCCNLRGHDPQQLVSCKEEASEMGGYFILNGLERVIRPVILPKRNYPMSTVRNSFRDRKEGYTDKAVVIRCARDDQSSVTVKLYYLQNGSARLGVWIQGKEFLLPVGLILKALVDTPDNELYASLTCCYPGKFEKGKGAVGTQLVGERAQIIINEVVELGFFTRGQCLENIGEHFQPLMSGLENESYSVVGDAVLKDYIFVHLDKNEDKFNLLIFMLQKLFSLMDQTSVLDNPDSLQNQEVLLPGHLITIYLKEKLEDWLQRTKKLLQDELIKENNNINFGSVDSLKKVLDKNPTRQISLAVENMLKTGRINTQTGLDLQQRAGFSVQAERLNFLRFLSHFRAVHRGASFAGLRTTSVRKLLPESWGFLCPVHTPDGEPCGLLNHMTRTCRITSYFDVQGNIRDFTKIRMSILNVLIEVGMIPSLPMLVHVGLPANLSVLLDGRVVGYISSTQVEKVVAHLRKLKVSAASVIPDDLEVGYVPLSMGGAYPGLYLFTSPSRFVRPVKNISISAVEGQNIELIGPFEQVFMEIKCPDGRDGGRKDAFPATHEEIHPTGMLSVVANLTPWSEHNQSPRNMYQCQVNIRFRHPRNPIIGDKFSSRHGQKGVCSQLWPDIDMPFSGVTGMRPDLIINPHAFPSRMTIAMLLESVAAKGGSLHGKFVDATPFANSEKKVNEETNGEKSKTLVDELGEMLKVKGFNYYGAEVRSTGMVDQVTRQPIKGRKRGGGIRFGEMERDSLLAHGAAYLLHDRLHTCSDYHIADVCSLCGSILTTSSVQPQVPVREIPGMPPMRAPKKVTCHACKTSKGMETVAMPYVFRYLAAELAAMNIKLNLQLSNATGA
ncbi:hypothetical protein ACLB2K_068757 [Fragaria x ananassa]